MHLIHKKKCFVIGLLLLVFNASSFAHGVDSNTEQFLTNTHGSAFMPFLYIGAKHMVTGYDHLLFLIDPENEEEELKRYQPLNDRLVERALRMGGTCTGEHGIGSGKIKYMEAEHGDSLDLMRQIKQAFDPDNLMNPGKMLPA